MSTQTHTRQPSGTPTGGQFAATTHTETGLSLTPTPRTPLKDTIEAQVVRRLTVSEPGYLRLSEKFEELHAQPLENAEDALAFLHKALEISKLTVRVERTENEGTPAGNEPLLDPNVGALTQVVEQVKPAGKAVIVENVAQDVDTIVRQVAFTGWSEKDNGDLRVRQELRKVLKRYGLSVVGEPFDFAYGYIRENY